MPRSPKCRRRSDHDAEDRDSHNPIFSLGRLRLPNLSCRPGRLPDARGRGRIKGASIHRGLRPTSDMRRWAPLQITITDVGRLFINRLATRRGDALGRTSRVWDALFANERASGGVDGRAGLFFSGCGGGNFGRGRERLSPTTLIKIGWPRGRAAQHFKGFRSRGRMHSPCDRAGVRKVN